MVPALRPKTANRLLDTLSTALFLLDGERRLTYLNVAGEALLGISHNQAQGRQLTELILNGEALNALIERAQRAGRAFSRRELLLRPLNKEGELTVDCTVTPYDDESLPAAVLIEISDTTRHQRISRETALLTQIGGSRLMIRQLAHEIKNPLGGLRGAAQLLARQLSDESMHEYTNVIISEADRLALLVDTLLGPVHAPRKEAVNVHELLQHVSHLLTADEPSLIIERDYDPSLPPALLDRNLIIQAMLNLGRNAVQAMEHQQGERRLILRTRALTNVNIGTRRHRLVVSIQFEDNGPGVPEHLRDTLFYPLVTGRASGTGLGLPVAQDLASRHDGLIEFDSRPGATTFTLLLPFHVAEHQTA